MNRSPNAFHVCLPGCQRVISLWDSHIRKKVRPAEEGGADLASASLQITAQSSSSSTSCRSLPFVWNSVGHDHKRRLVARLIHPSIHSSMRNSPVSSLMLDRQRDRPMKKASHVASDPVNGNPLAPSLSADRRNRRRGRGRRLSCGASAAQLRQIFMASLGTERERERGKLCCLCSRRSKHFRLR